MKLAPIAAPTATSFSEIATEPTSERMLELSVAVTRTVPALPVVSVSVTEVLPFTSAEVVPMMPLSANEAPTARPLPEIAAPTAKESMLEAVLAATTRSPPERVSEASATSATVRVAIWFQASAAPIPLPCSPRPSAPATEKISAASVARIETPPASTRAPVSPA